MKKEQKEGRRAGKEACLLVLLEFLTNAVTDFLVG